MVIDMSAPMPQLQQFIAEHEALKKEVDAVQDKADLMVSQLGTERCRMLLEEIRAEMAVILRQLKEHEVWEGCVSRETGPALATTKWVLEEDHKLAERFVKSFIHAADNCCTSDIKQLTEAASLLSVACSVLADHLVSEEELFQGYLEERH